ncbi:hypothetical protein Y695_02253 [Hydrogenophaga sp. T4]|nr:hypothetical protein Y695_02253 [Hydrogenophaga sp. T4]
MVLPGTQNGLGPGCVLRQPGGPVACLGTMAQNHIGVRIKQGQQVLHGRPDRRWQQRWMKAEHLVKAGLEQVLHQPRAQCLAGVGERVVKRPDVVVGQRQVRQAQGADGRVGGHRHRRCVQAQQKEVVCLRLLATQLVQPVAGGGDLCAARHGGESPFHAVQAKTSACLNAAPAWSLPDSRGATCKGQSMARSGSFQTMQRSKAGA